MVRGTRAWLRKGSNVKPSDDAAFRRWKAHTIESRERNLNTKDLVRCMPFRCAAALIAKKHGLTMTCAALESNVYTLQA